MSGALAGRTSELARLAELLARPPEPPGRVIVVTGEAGIGKTRLLAEALPAERISAWISFPSARFAGPGFGLRRLADSTGVRGAALQRRLQLPDAAPDPTGLAMICEAADEVVRADAGKVLVLDDLQWADELTLAWLARSAPLLASTPLLVALGVRTAGTLPRGIEDALADHRRSGLVDVLALEPLSSMAVADMVRRSGVATTDEFTARLHDRSGGIPLAVEDLLRDLDKSGLSPDEWRRRQGDDAGAGGLVVTVVRQQLAELGEQARRVVACAAVTASSATEELVAATLGLDTLTFNAALQDALAVGLVVHDSRGALTFRHELHRELVQRDLPLAHSRALHADVAAVLIGTGAPAGEIAGHLLNAGAFADAVGWLERAAEEAAVAHDHGTALHHLRAALRLHAATDGATVVRLADRTVLAARLSNKLSEGVQVVEEALDEVRTPDQRAGLLLCRARLVSYLGDYADRVRTLNTARDAFARINDRRGIAVSLAELSFPVGRTPALAERIQLGRDGLALAEEIGESEVTALCAVNLASALMYDGEAEAFQLWARAVQQERHRTTVSRSELALRGLTNWAASLVAYGDYPSAREVIDETLSECSTPYWRQSLHGVNTLLLYRTGCWDEALSEAARASSAGRPPVAALAAVVGAAIEFERAGRPDVAPLVQAAESLVEWEDAEWAAVAHAVLMTVRAARREPRPHRGLDAVIELLESTHLRVGWDDLLVAVARMDARLYQRTLKVVEDFLPRGPRAAASAMLCGGLVAANNGDCDADDTLLAAADAFAALGEPFTRAVALEAAANARLAQGRRAGRLRHEAATIYQELGASRSLATLVRRSKGSRAVAEFMVPARQAHLPSPGLTPREQQIAELAAQGLATRTIAEQLGISPTTAKKHLERVKDKLGAARKSDLVRLLGRA